MRKIFLAAEQPNERRGEKQYRENDLCDEYRHLPVPEVRKRGDPDQTNGSKVYQQDGIFGYDVNAYLFLNVSVASPAVIVILAVSIYSKFTPLIIAGKSRIAAGFSCYLLIWWLLDP